MIAFIRVSFPDTSPSFVWTDAETRAFMDPSIPYSLAHFWAATTFGQVDMSHVLFAPITITDPRPEYTDRTQQRHALVNAVLVELHRAASPDWDTIDQCFILFSQPGTDLFGTPIGGGYFTPASSYHPVAVFSRGARFDTIAQEVGHCLGLSHELTAALVEYGCPYSVMSASNSFAFDRPPDPRLPEAPDPTSGNRTCGPLVPAAHLYLNAGRTVDPKVWFDKPETVAVVPQDYVQRPRRVTLAARDAAIAALPARRVVLAVIPPVMAGGESYFLELRRPDAQYEQCIVNPAVVILAGKIPNGVGVAIDTRSVRLRYLGRIDLTGGGGPRSFVSTDGAFKAHIASTAPDFGSVEVSISSGGGSGSFGVYCSEPAVTRALNRQSEWTTAEVKACRSYPERSYSFRATYYFTTQLFVARALGYQQPRYAWYVNDVLVDPAARHMEVDAVCCLFFGGRVEDPATRSVFFNCAVNDGQFEMRTTEDLYDVDISVRVEVSEGSGAVAPTRSAFVTGDHGNIDVEWDSAFQSDRAECLRAELAEHTGLVIPGDGAGTPGHLTPAQIQQAILEQLGIGMGIEGF